MIAIEFLGIFGALLGNSNVFSVHYVAAMQCHHRNFASAPLPNHRLMYGTVNEKNTDETRLFKVIWFKSDKQRWKKAVLQNLLLKVVLVMNNAKNKQQQQPKVIIIVVYFKPLYIFISYLFVNVWLLHRSILVLTSFDLGRSDLSPNSDPCPMRDDNPDRIVPISWALNSIALDL